jgi:DNA polymerase I
MEKTETKLDVAGSKLLLVDGHAYAYRAFFAIRKLNAPDGRPTNAIYGFVKMLGKLLEMFKPTHCAVVWDGGLDESRMEVLPGYKAQRPAMPNDLESQLDPIVEYLNAAGVVSLCQDGIEADDWIAVLAQNVSCPVIIASSDKDFMQLVSERVRLVNPNDKHEVVWGHEEVVKRTGVAPNQIVDWLSLVGDSVDNIPGAPGVGPKTATQLLTEFGTLEALLARVQEVKSERLRENVGKSAEILKRNQQLIRLRADLPLRRSLADLAMRAPQGPALLEICGRWGFKSMYKELENKYMAEPVLL